MRDSLLLYRSTLDGLLSLPPEEVKAALTALKEYAMDDKEEDHGPTAAAVLAMTKPLIDANNKKVQAGRLGGLSKQTEANAKQTEATVKQTEANRSIVEADASTAKLKEKGERRNIKESVARATQKKFEPPALEDVKAYISEKGYSVDAEVFVDFYASKNWMVGKNKMSDWKAAVRNWARSRRQESPTESSKRQEVTAKIDQYNDFPQRDYDVGALERQLLGGG